MTYWEKNDSEWKLFSFWTGCGVGQGTTRLLCYDPVIETNLAIIIYRIGSGSVQNGHLSRLTHCRPPHHPCRRPVWNQGPSEYHQHFFLPIVVYGLPKGNTIYGHDNDQWDCQLPHHIPPVICASPVPVCNPTQASGRAVARYVTTRLQSSRQVSPFKPSSSSQPSQYSTR